MKRETRARSRADISSPFAAARRILCGPTKHEPRPVEQRLADVSLLDEIASLDAATAKSAFERMEQARAAGDEVDPADVQLYTSSAESARRSVVEKAKTLGTYGGESPNRDRAPSFRVFVSTGALPADTGADDAEEILPDKTS